MLFVFGIGDDVGALKKIVNITNSSNKSKTFISLKNSEINMVSRIHEIKKKITKEDLK